MYFNRWNIHKIIPNCYDCELKGVATHFHHPSWFSGDRTCVRIDIAFKMLKSLQKFKLEVYRNFVLLFIIVNFWNI